MTNILPLGRLLPTFLDGKCPALWKYFKGAPSCKESVGIFDISHMGAVFISGRESAVWLDKHLANDLDL